MVDSRTVVAGFSDELVAVVGTLLEKAATGRTSQAPLEPGYVVSIEGSRGAKGSLHIYFDRSRADALAKRLTGAAVDPPQAAVLESLKELCGQAATSLADKHPHIHVQLHVSSAHRCAEVPQDQDGTAVEINVEGDEGPTLRVAFTGTLELAPESEPGDAPGASPSLDVILDISLPLVVRFGQTEMSLKDIAALGPGSLINLGRSPDDSVDVLVSNQIVAKGEVVVVSGSYGVRIRDVVSPAERVRSMEVAI